MSFQVLPPQFDVAKKCYTFTFKNAPKIEEITTDPTKLSITEEDLKEIFIHDFLEQASKYFSKSLDEAVFFKRLVYEWITDEVDLAGRVGETFRATWIPARLVFFTTRYELYFSLSELEEVVTSKVDPGFLDQLGVTGEELPPETVETELPELPIAEVTQEIIPFGKLSEEERALRESGRKRVRQARLKASLARLHAEEMAERYYKRYGNFDIPDSESELTSEEER
jgi:hypothetical protein